MSSAAVFISSGSYAASGEHYQQTLAEPRLLHSSPVELITATAFCTVSLHKSSVDFRWFWTLLPVWSLVLADTTISRWPFATCFIGSECHSEYSSTQNSNLCVWLCPWAPSCLLQQRLHPRRRHFWSGTSSFGRMPWHDIHSTRTQLGRWSFHVAAPPSGTCFHHSSAHHPLVVDSLELAWKPISSHRPTDTSENFCIYKIRPQIKH